MIAMRTVTLHQRLHKHPQIKILLTVLNTVYQIGEILRWVVAIITSVNVHMEGAPSYLARTLIQFLYKAKTTVIGDITYLVVTNRR